MKFRTLARVGCIAFALLVLATACGGAKSPTAKERPLTSEEASTLADSLYRNWLDQGATFVANAARIDLGQTITMTGEVDWVNRQGHAQVQSMGSELGLTEVWWNKNLVIESWPAIEPMLNSIGYTSVRFISRTLAPETRLVDRTIAIVTSLASAQPENALLIQQKPGSAFLREDELRDTSVQVLRYGERNLYWLALSSGQMMRFDSNTVNGAAPVVVDLLTEGTQKITPPPAEMTVPADSIKTLYRSLLGD